MKRAAADVGTSPAKAFAILDLGLLLPMNTTLITLRGIMLVGALLLGDSALADAPPKFPVTSLSAGIYLVRAEVAATEPQREQGLMFRQKMGPNEGMVFLFGEPVGSCMWMKNTLLALSVAFIDSSGKIVNIEDMQPQTTDSHCAKKPVAYALEMNLGWFKQKNIRPGSVIDGLPATR